MASHPFAFVLDPVFETHNPGEGHPERPDRVRAIREAIEGQNSYADLPRLPLREVTRAELERAHTATYLDQIESLSKQAPVTLDGGDTVLGTGSLKVAKQAAGSVTELALKIWEGTYRSGFAAVRPPGHHAERDRAMGFCVYGNIAVAAAAVRAAGANRVLIIDWDVHHGNGTQNIFEEDPNVFFASVHQSPLYPGTGARSERGIGKGEGFTWNYPLTPGMGDAEFLDALGKQLEPEVEKFKPQMIFLSAGFDAHERDPLANLTVTTEGFYEAGLLIRDYAERFANGKLLSVLEGGYDLTALSEGTLAHLRAIVPT